MYHPLFWLLSPPRLPLLIGFDFSDGFRIIWRPSENFIMLCNDRVESDAGVCSEGFGRIWRQRDDDEFNGIEAGHCADYDHAGRLGADDEHADDNGAAAGGEPDRVFVRRFQRIQYVQRWECAEGFQ